MRADADEGTSNRHLEAYLLWLFGYIMFCGSQGDAVSRFLIPHARMIAEGAAFRRGMGERREQHRQGGANPYDAAWREYL
jgi:hypothetical protein